MTVRTSAGAAGVGQLAGAELEDLPPRRQRWHRSGAAVADQRENGDDPGQDGRAEPGQPAERGHPAGRHVRLHRGGNGGRVCGSSVTVRWNECGRGR